MSNNFKLIAVSTNLDNEEKLEIFFISLHALEAKTSCIEVRQQQDKEIAAGLQKNWKKNREGKKEKYTHARTHAEKSWPKLAGFLFPFLFGKNKEKKR